MCARGSAQHGQNPAGYAATETRWTHRHAQVATLAETLVFLRDCHRAAPFLLNERGSLTGEVLEVYEDGRVRWRSAQGGVLIATAESLIKIPPANGGAK